MNSRVAILTTVCLLFALAWRGDGDRRSSGQGVAVRGSIPSHLLAAARRRTPSGKGLVAVEPSHETLGAHGIVTASSARFGRETHRPLAQGDLPAETVRVVTTAARDVAPPATAAPTVAPLPVDVPLPVDIAVGEYRVVGARGDVFGLLLTTELAVERGLSTDVTPRPHYVRELHGATWHFVRVTPTASHSVTAIERRDPADDARPGTIPAAWFEAAIDGLHRATDVVASQAERMRTATAAAFRRTADRLVRGTLASLGTARAATSASIGETRRR
jgi:hypothetical protein